MALPSAPLSIEPIARSHAADEIFDQLAAALLKGDLPIGAALPPERVLAERFGVSRIIARQAVHKLAEMGLVRVRQGGTTVVLDPEQSSDLRVIELMYRLGPSTAGDVLDFTERQLLNGEVLLRVAARRASRAELEAIAAIVEAYCASGAAEAELTAFEERFWRAVARAGKNRLCIFEVNWWFKLLAEQPRAQHPIVAPPHIRVAVLRELARRLIAGEDAAGFYLKMITPMIDHVEHTARTKRPRRKR
ncbi:MAG TPA: GntR family transcriptional regulator [Polyangia bacterium]|nr:GntR family transcriptional regulator [Polyangia bacterium]